MPRKNKITKIETTIKEISDSLSKMLTPEQFTPLKKKLDSMTATTNLLSSKQNKGNKALVEPQEVEPAVLELLKIKKGSEDTSRSKLFMHLNAYARENDMVEKTTVTRENGKVGSKTVINLSPELQQLLKSDEKQIKHVKLQSLINNIIIK